mmetsp:Transcript_176622/g.566321  ORF Transcript_176622/g.566321 Transcript_176622/m.566321 type:complete len:97 (+) Transcript_176622:50-340(+)
MNTESSRRAWRAHTRARISSVGTTRSPVGNAGGGVAGAMEQVVLGWEVCPEAWAHETDLQVSDVKVVLYLDQSTAGEVGWGYAYLPECDHSDLRQT